MDTLNDDSIERNNYNNDDEDDLFSHLEKVEKAE
jgi:hypothetical protein